MITYPNQKLYHIKKKIEEGDIFIMLKWEDYIAAARELSPSALNLYMYLAKNQDNYLLAFSSKDYCNTFQVVDKTYRNARKELFSKGYLKENGNHIYFDSKGGYKITKESIRAKIVELGKMLQIKDRERYKKALEELEKVDLKSIENEQIYIIEGKKIISFCEDLLKEISENEISGLI